MHCRVSTFWRWGLDESVLGVSATSSDDGITVVQENVLGVHARAIAFEWRRELASNSEFGVDGLNGVLFMLQEPTGNGQLGLDGLGVVLVALGVVVELVGADHEAEWVESERFASGLGGDGSSVKSHRSGLVDGSRNDQGGESDDGEEGGELHVG